MDLLTRTPLDAAGLVTALDRDGWAVTPPLIPDDTLDALGAELAAAYSGAEGRGGYRNVLDLTGVRELAQSEAIRGLVEAVLGLGCAAVRGLLFDKSPEANWSVPWHQDLTVALDRRAEVDGFGPWTRKAGVDHAVAPEAVLARMVTVRVHLDPCGPDNGPLRVVPGSHRAGKLDPEVVLGRVARVDPVACPVGRGGLLLFRPLLIHGSSPAERPDRRRVVHLEYAAGPPPAGLAWRWVV